MTTDGLAFAEARLQLERDYGLDDHAVFIIIDVGRQRLALAKGEQIINWWPISTSSRGIGNREGSLQTPVGVHEIAEKIGDAAPFAAIFKGRKLTGDIAAIHQHDSPCPDDIITTRILWLRGLEVGINQGPNVDSYERYIYIHGTSDEAHIGTPASQGCIRMRNQDVLDLYDRVDPGTLVLITQGNPHTG